MSRHQSKHPRYAAQGVFKKNPSRPISQPTQDETHALLDAFNAGHLPEVERLAKKLIGKFPHHVFGWKALGVVLQKSGRSLEALAPMRQAIHLAPNDAVAHSNLGATLERLGQLKEAEVNCRAAIRLKPDFPDAHNNLGNVLKAMGQVKEALPHYQEAIRLKPSFLEADLHLNNLRAEQALEQGELFQALECLRRLLSLQLDQGVQTVVRPDPTPVFNSAGNEALMWKTLAQLAAVGVHAFPIAGTLLGLVRDGHLLPWDKDVDFGLPFNQMAPAKACLLAHGWVEVTQKLRLLNPLGFKHLETGVCLDLFGCVRDVDNNVFISGIWQEGQPWAMQRVTEFPASLTLQSIQRPEGRIWVLQNPESWLVPVYGETWRIPDPDFDTVVAARNLRGFTPLTQIYGLMRINGHLQQGRLRKAQATTRHCLRHLPEDELLKRTEMCLTAAMSHPVLDVDVAPHKGAE